ncbi:WD40 repeat domain-containing protein [Gallaecimonas pentaromativorans]|uniref:WD-40 repeat-containing protein n=1 Tax=Gallaecimonas pentaromativorans TaxID=584787 RepID=A0A3N1P4H2_9GAMM|nr:PQQ-binding-like beta-propeller repeat protein [Gallaecimonas pentaromativorans]ROQ23395.1 WD-40 repeat-containing protein [Gallaecimonas pentaromativorans]
MPRVLLFCVVLLFGCSPKPQSLASWPVVGNGAYGADISVPAGLAAISGDPEGVVVWSLKDNKPRYRLQMNVAPPTKAALTRDGYKPDDRLPAEPLPVTLVRFSVNGDYLVTADQTRIALWKSDDGENLGYWQAGSYRGSPRIDEPGTSQVQTLRDIAVSSGGNFIAYAQADGVVTHFNRITGRRLEFLGHSEKVNSIAMSGNGLYVLSGGNDHRAFLWNSQTGQVVRKFDASNRVVLVAMTDDGRYAFTDDADNNAVVWDIRTGEVKARLVTKAKQELFTAARFSSDGNRLLTGGPGRQLIMWDTQSGQRLWQTEVGVSKGFGPRSAVVYATAFARDRVYSVSSAGLLEAWPLEKPHE